jgi:acid phosphatase
VTNRRRWPRLLVAVALDVALAGSASLFPGHAPAAAAAVAADPAAIGVPTGSVEVQAAPGSGITTVWWIVMENRSYGSIVGSASAPYLNGLIAGYGLATGYYAVAHPSEPNYIAATSGSTRGVRDDGRHDLSSPSLFGQLDAAHLSWRVYAQDYPGNCFMGASYRGGVDGPGAGGWYARKHNPALSYRSVSENPADCARVVPLAGFNAGAQSFALIVPNMTNDMHDGSVAQGDAFLRAFVPSIIGSPAFAHGVLFITWDEGTSSVGGGGRVATLVIRPGMMPGFRSAARHDHYGLLRTVESIFGLPCLANACRRPALNEFL